MRLQGTCECPPILSPYSRCVHWAAASRGLQAGRRRACRCGLYLCVQGGADRSMAFALVGYVHLSVPGAGLHPSYLADLAAWEERARSARLSLT